MDDEHVIKVTRNWVEKFVIQLNLCPFAKREWANNRIRFITTNAVDEEHLLEALQNELFNLNNDSSIETTLLIHKNVLNDFYEYNEFLNLSDRLLAEMELDGIYQIASFHPSYQFEGTKPDDAENYTNRSPFPMLHILKEDSLERVIENYPNVEKIPVENINLMKDLGYSKLKKMLHACHQKNNSN